MKNTFAICTLSACLIAPISGAVGFIAGTHHYANADLTTKLELQRVRLDMTGQGPTIQERCARDWGTNYLLRRSCVDWQLEAKQRGGF